MQKKHGNDFNRITKTYIHSLSDKKYRPLDSDTERDLIERLNKGDEKAKHQLIEAHLRLVVNIASRYRNKGVDMADLIQEGNLGLYEALNRFDGNRNIRFCVYAKWWISKYVMTAISENNVNVNNDIIINNINDGQARTEDGDGFHDDSREDEEEGREDCVEDDSEGKRCSMEVIENLLSSLDERMRFIIEAFYGLNNKKQMTMIEIGDVLGLSPERIRQLKNKGMVILRTSALSQSLSYCNF